MCRRDAPPNVWVSASRAFSVRPIVYKGRNRDTAWFSILDREWPALRGAYEQWLSPANFDDSGRQRRRLADLIEHARADHSGA